MEYDERYVVTQLHAESFVDLNKSYAEIKSEDFLVLAFCHLAVEVGGLSGDVSEVQSAVAALKLKFDLKKYDERRLYNTFSTHYSQLVKSSRGEFDNSEAVRVATYLIDKFICYKCSIHHARPRVVASFVKSIQADVASLTVDMIPLVSELAIPGADYGLYSEGLTNSFLGHALRLKLFLNGVRYRILELEDFDGLSGSETYIFDSPGPHLPMHTYLNRFEQLSRRNGLRGKFVIVMPLGKETQRDVAKYVSPFINEWIHLDAVVTISSSGLRESNSTFLILVLSNNAPVADRFTLYIDVSRSNPSISELDPEDCALLAGAVFNLHKGNNLFNENITPRVMSILNAQFPSGYRDVRLLCAEVAHNHKKLLKIHPVKSILNRKAKRASSITFSADLREVISRIQSNEQSTCTYVIGSNGAGKSLMLRELIYRMSESNVETVGVSTGVHDRFPLDDENLKLFTYKGLRNRSEGITIPRLAQNATRLAAYIFKRQDLIDVLTECLFCFGYEARYYLVRKPQTTLEELPANVRFVPLGIVAAENILPQDLHSYEFGVVRADDKERISPISSLSSGEQNINFILLTILRSAARDTLFLLDEPEISLHLQWQQALPKVLSIMSDRFGMSFVVATHSPTIISNANEINSYSYDLRQGKLRLLTDEQRYSVESIILEGFGTYTPNNRGVHEKCARLVAGSMMDGDGDAILGGESLKQLGELRCLLLGKVNRTNIPGMREDLDLIEKAYNAIELLMKDRRLQDEFPSVDVAYE
ncbi:hypothetical protein DOZ80_02640 [Pseudomonas fluorescens]|uniref:ATPase AAA-type core domain-containing protein n=1 Tax=Pseudomonas fluorescens TaxID=294 RepID=A0A327NDX1_PSEFL|nr:AAA family ATPase [Pseudomonas fluorescens]RAI72459.1 hypothetical protein DOZ80_02640 [Pseudomonas fluorescens]